MSSPEDSTIPKGIMASHWKNGKLTAGRFENFEQYVESEGHGLSLEEANKKSQLGAIFLKQIQEWAKSGNQPKSSMKNREENISNLIWFLTKKSFDHGTPMDAGMYTIGLENENQTKYLYDYLKGKPGLGAVSRGVIGFGINVLTGILNIIPGIINAITPKSWPKPYFPPISKIFGLGTDPERSAYSRASSHFKKRVKNGHFGYDILKDENVLPGKYKSIVFGSMDDGRIYIKPEEHGMDPIHQPGEALLHSMGFLASRKHRGKAVQRTDQTTTGQKGVEVARKEHRVTNEKIINKYKELIKKKSDLVAKKIINDIKKDNPTYNAALLEKLAALKNKKNLSKLEKEIIKKPEYKSYIKLLKMASKPKGDLDKMRSDIMKDDGGSTPSDRQTMLAEFNSAWTSSQKDRSESSNELAVQYGDENAFTFRKETLSQISEPKQAQNLDSPTSETDSVSQAPADFRKRLGKLEKINQASLNSDKPEKSWYRRLFKGKLKENQQERELRNKPKNLEKPKRKNPSGP